MGALAAMVSVLGGALVIRLAVQSAQNRGSRVGSLIAAVGFLTKLPIVIGVGMVAYGLGRECWTGFVPAFVVVFIGLLVMLHFRSLRT